MTTPYKTRSAILSFVVLQLLFTVSIGLAVLTATVLLVGVWSLIFSRSSQKSEIPVLSVVGSPTERYKPMLRLLEEQDFVFLRSQPGFKEAMAVRLREHRYRMFMAYLESLRADFDGIVAALKSVLAKADHDRPSLAFTLIRAQLSFGCAFLIVSVRARIWRKHRGTVDARHLLRAFQAMHRELRSLSAVTAVA